MSTVTNIVIFAACGEVLYRDDAPVMEGAAYSPALLAINEKLHDAGHRPGLKPVDSYFGGPKYAEIECWAAAFNCLDLEVFFTFLQEVPWQAPEQVRICVRRQDDSVMTMVSLADLASGTWKDILGDYT